MGAGPSPRTVRPLWRPRLARVAQCPLTLGIAAFRAQGRLSQLSAINRHNQQLFDHFVGAQQNRWGYRKTERGGLEVHDHLKFGRELNGQRQNGISVPRRLCSI
jgi:hypothetical protein